MGRTNPILMLLDLLENPKTCVLRLVLWILLMGVFYLVVYFQKLLWNGLKIDIGLDVLLILSLVFMVALILWWRWQGYTLWIEVIAPALKRRVLKQEEEDTSEPGDPPLRDVWKDPNDSAYPDDADVQRFPHGK